MPSIATLFATQPSQRAARRSAGPLLPPIQIGPGQSSRTTLEAVVEQTRAPVRVGVLAEARELLLVAAEPGAEDDAAAVERFERSDLLRDDLRAAARQRRDGGAERERARLGRDRGERHPRIRGRRPPHEREVVPDEEAVPPRRLGRLRDTQRLPRVRVGPEVRETDARTSPTG